MSVQYQMKVADSGGRELVANITGQADDDSLSPEAYRYEIYAYDKSTFQQLWKFALRIEAARKLFAHLGQVSMVTESNQNETTKFIEVGQHGVPEDIVAAVQGGGAGLFRAILAKDLDAVQSFVESEISDRDIISISYRKGQLDLMEQLISDEAVFACKRTEWGCSGTEAVWQKFFDANRWIFGHGLSTLWLSGVDDERLEQVTTGATVAEAGKRVDALMRTRGLINSMCFVEIKHHDTSLLGSEYRSKVYPPSKELAGAVAQVRKTVYAASESLGGIFQHEDDDGEPTGETTFNILPRSFVICGSNSEFVGENGANRHKVTAFELYRQQSASTEILTFDELLERARYIVDEGHGSQRSKLC